MTPRNLHRDMANKLIQKMDDTYAPLWLRAAAGTVFALWCGLVVAMCGVIMVSVVMVVIALFSLHWFIGAIAALAMFYGFVLFAFWVCN